MIQALLLSLSIFGMVSQNSILNYSGKGFLKDGVGVSRFNVTMYLVSFLLFLCLAFTGGISHYTAIVALFYGLATIISNVFRMKALAEGPMHVTTLITTSSMIIPALSGIFFGEKLSIIKLVAIFVLLVFVFLSLERGENTKINKKWIIYCAIAFIALGAIGVLQKLHQSSEHKGELFSFLAIAFFASLLFGTPKAAMEWKKKKFTVKQNIFALLCGVITFAVNFINLKLSGEMPSQIFFPIVNGGGIILSLLSAKILFKEKFTVRQIIGIVGGIASLVVICIF